jgi:hypothetical protein
MKEVKKLKGGNSLMENEGVMNKELEVQENEEVKEPAIEFAAAEDENASAAIEEPIVEENHEEEDKSVLFNLEDFQNL